MIENQDIVMCVNIIIDADVAGIFIKNEVDGGDGLLHDWIGQGHGVVVYSPSDKYKKEIRKGTTIFNLFEEYRRSGLAHRIDPLEVQRKEEHEINQSKMRSKDFYILALALASNALVLYTNDGKLRKDFTNQELLPKIRNRRRAVYPTNRKKQRQFLYERRCPHT